MKPLRKWSARLLLALALLLVAGWAWAEASQWLLRYRAQKMLADIRSLEVNRTTSAEAQALLNNWREWAEIDSRCSDGVCFHRALVRNIFTDILLSVQDDGAAPVPRRLLDYAGLRGAWALSEFTLKDGLVSSKGFTEMVGLPYRDWYLRGGAEVFELVVSSEEAVAFREFDQHHVKPVNPNRLAHYIRGPYGVIIKFNPKESASVKADLMDFHFSCMTSFSPCHTESEILPAASRFFTKELSLERFMDR